MKLRAFWLHCDENKALYVLIAIIMKMKICAFWLLCAMKMKICVFLITICDENDDLCVLTIICDENEALYVLTTIRDENKVFLRFDYYLQWKQSFLRFDSYLQWKIMPRETKKYDFIVLIFFCEKKLRFLTFSLLFAGKKKHHQPCALSRAPVRPCARPRSQKEKT